MHRIEGIYNHSLWKNSLEKIRTVEKERIYCGHDIGHLMDVARIAYIENLEKGLGISKELIYAAALLHDIGRAAQYLEGISHEEAGVKISREILQDSSFDRKEQEEILRAIGEHRNVETASADTLQGLIYRADKASRLCLFCKAAQTCNWSDEKKNLTLRI